MLAFFATDSAVRYSNAVYSIIHFLARAFFELYGSWEIDGQSNIPPTGPVIITPNHVSYLDPPLVGAAVVRECAFMARHDLWHNRILNWLLPYLGAFPIHRGQPDRAAMRRALDELARGKVLIMFPEGTRSPDGMLQRAEPGVALIVQKSEAPVVPCVVIGSEQMMTPGQRGIRRAKLHVIFGRPLQFAHDSSRQEVVDAIMRSIADLLTANGRPESARLPAASVQSNFASAGVEPEIGSLPAESV